MKRLFQILTAAVLTAALLCSCSIEDLWAALDPYGGKLAVHFLDVGQGDSVFIQLPNDETMLIDAGENYHGEGIIDYIEGVGESKIDYLIGTHPHNDHIGSLPYIVRNFDIGAVYMPKVSANTKIYESLLKSLKNKGLKIKNGKAGVKLVEDEDLTVDIVAPVKIDDDLNNCSIVIKITYGNRSFLFTGDAETEEFGTITADVSADVLKVGHHGSRTSTTKKIAERINPEIAVISCGENNDYGHPHKAALEALEGIGCEIYRTDKDGTVTVVCDGNSLEVETGNKSIMRANQ